MEKTIGFNIEVRGTEEENLKMTSLKKSIFETADRLKTLREITKGNVEAQKEYAATIVSLETHLKAETKALNELQASQVKSSLAINNAAGSYNSLVEENRKLSEELRALPIDVTSEQFKKMSIQMAENQLKMNQFNEGIGRFHGNVGNYTGKVFTYSKGIKGLADTALVAAQAFGANSKAIEIAINLTQVFSVVNRTAKDVTKALTVSKDADTAATKALTVSKGADTAATKEQTLAQRIYAAVVGQSTGAMKAFKIALVSTGIGALILALGYAVSKMVEYATATDEAKDSTDKFAESIKRLREENEQRINLLKAQGKETDALQVEQLKKELEILEAKKFNDDLERSRIDITKEQRAENEKTYQETIDQIKKTQNAIEILNAQIKTKERDETGEFVKDIAEANQELHDKNVEAAKKSAEKRKKIADDLKDHEGKQIREQLDEEQKAADERLRQAKELADLIRKYDQESQEGFLHAVQTTQSKELEEYKKHIEDLKFIVDESLSFIDGIEEGYFQTRMQRLDLELDLKKQAIESQNETDQNILKNQLDKGLISEQQYRDKKYQMDAEFQKRQLELRRKQAQEERKIKTIELSVDYAKTIAEIWLQALASADSVATFGLSGTTKALISTGIASGNYLAQLGFMNAQKFSKGGLVVGSGSSTSDSIPMFASNGESMNNAKTTGMFYNELSAMNVAGGGVPFPNAQPPSFDFISNSITKQDLAIMVQAINDKRVYIVESEIRGAHKKAEIFERNNEF
jgi:hypothetical protein